MPTTPQNAAGCRIEPPVSVPRENRHSSAATAADDPPDDPPGTVSRFHGLRVGKKPEFSVDEPMANSSQLVLPVNTAPASRSLATTVPSNLGTKFSRMRDEHVVRTPSVTSTSLIALG